MRYLISGLILLALSIYLGIEISKTHNTVMIVIDHWVIESSLWVALLSLIILFIALYLFFRLLGKLLGISKQLQHWKKLRRDRKARLLTNEGLCDLVEGNWQQAESTLLKAARNNRRPLIDYLAAAKAAQAQHAYDRRDTYLRRAYQSDAKTTVAVGLTQAQLQIQSQQWEQALATLQHLRQKAPHHGFILKLLATVYMNLQEWGQCHQLLPLLKRSKALAKKELNQLEQTVYLALLKDSANKEYSILETTWKTLPKEFKQNTEAVYYYVKGLLKWQQDEIAYNTLVSFLKRNWDSKLVELFGQIQHENNAKQIDLAERWLQKHPQDDTLLLTLGELCLREKLWGKAETYLCQAIAIHPSMLGYIKLGNLYEALGDSTKAQENLKQLIGFVRN